MKKCIFLIIGFALGYYAHIWVQSHGQSVITTVIPPSTEQTKQTDSFFTDISYKDGHFEPSYVKVKVGNYLTITNRSTSLMWLVSDHTKLNTVRGYGESEQLKIMADKEGSYTIGNKLNLNAKATIVIEK